MEDSNLLYEAWVEERQLFVENLVRLKTTITKKVIHDIRVCIKKMKAYRNLFYLLNEDESKIKFTQTNKLFDVFGKLRNIHICLDSLKDHEKETNNSYRDLKRFLNGRIKQAKSWSKETIKNYNDKELHKFELLLASMRSDDLKKSVGSEIDSILNNLEDIIDEPHQMRKVLKKTYYWIKILPDKQAEEDYKVDKLNEVTDNLGTWQDNEILLTEIRYFRKELLPGSFEERKQLKALQKNIKEKKDSLVNKTLNDLDFIRK